MRRDRLTFAMMIGIPMMQLVLFGFAINSDPKHLPDGGRRARPQRPRRAASCARPAEQRLLPRGRERRRARARPSALIARGDVQFVLVDPGRLHARVLRGERPALLVEADATDPAATGNAIAALLDLPRSRAAPRPARAARTAAGRSAGPFELRVHRRYNPEGITSYNIVPGLMGVILTMTMVMMTALAMTRERERGTMENLLATPVRPFEVMIGKIVPYIAIGYVQVLIVILLAARLLFKVPMVGSLALLLGR